MKSDFAVLMARLLNLWKLPEIPPGKKGWGASGNLDLDLIRKMASA